MFQFQYEAHAEDVIHWSRMLGRAIFKSAPLRALIGLRPESYIGGPIPSISPLFRPTFNCLYAYHVLISFNDTEQLVSNISSSTSLLDVSYLLGKMQSLMTVEQPFSAEMLGDGHNTGRSMDASKTFWPLIQVLMEAPSGYERSPNS